MGSLASLFLFLCLAAGFVFAQDAQVPTLRAGEPALRLDTGASIAEPPIHEGHLERPPAHFHFAVPDFESRISLGIFNDRGELIRSIAEAVPEADFLVGLNGLNAQWDWKDNQGSLVPEGEYFIRGFAVGNFTQTPPESISVSWQDAFGGGLGIQEIRQLELGKNGLLFVLATDEAQKSILLAYDPATDTRLWSRTLGEGESWILGRPADPVLAAMGGGELEIIEPETGTVLLRGQLGAPQEEIYSLQLGAEELSWVTEAGVRRVSMVDLAPLEAPSGLPREIREYYKDESGGLALDKDGRLWIGDRSWTIFLNKEGAWFSDFVAGREGRFWTLVRERPGGEQRLGQFDRDGEFLRQIQPQTFAGTPLLFTASRDENTLVVLSRKPEEQLAQILGIRRRVLDGPSSWETFWEKRRDPRGYLHADGFRMLPLRMKLDVTSALGLGRESSIFRIIAKDEGIYLGTPEGLLLGALWKDEGILAASAASVPGNPRALTFRMLFEGRIEVGEIAGLDRIARLDGGRLVWPPEEE